MPWLRKMKDLRVNLIVPLVAQRKLLGIAGFGGSSLRKKLSTKEKTYIKSLMNIAASAIEKSATICGNLQPTDRMSDYSTMAQIQCSRPPFIIPRCA